MEFSVIIPVYNGEKTVTELHKSLKKALQNQHTFEIIFVHDCGKDESWSVISEIVKSDPGRTKGFRLNYNSGQHNALLFGIKQAKGDFIITLDEDLQHDPVYLNKMSEKQKEGNYDVVYARFMKLKHPGLRICTSELLRIILSRIVPGLYQQYSPFRFIKRDIAQRITILKNSYTFLDGYLGMVTDKFGFIDAEHFRRADGVSSYSYYKLFRHAIMIAIAYSPLKKWILTTALIFNSISILIYFGFGFIKDSSSIEFIGIVTGITGIILLLCGLLAEAIHYRGLKTNIMATAVLNDEIR
jgi:polyisoprenyl-phosphate glycosyltransferase